jgi:hypothetical protein
LKGHNLMALNSRDTGRNSAAVKGDQVEPLTVGSHAIRIEVKRDLRLVQQAHSSPGLRVANRYRRHGEPRDIGDKIACDGKSLLLQAYQMTIAVYAFAIRECQTKVGKIDEVSYNPLRRLMEDAREQHRRAQTELKEHVRYHGC